MTERDFTIKILGDLKRSLLGAVVLKHNDGSTAGIPDISISRRDRTSWAEIKYLRPGRTLKETNKVEQLVMCHQLATVNNGRCWVIVFAGTPRPSMTVWQPRALFAHLWPNLAGPSIEHAAWKKIDRDPILLDSLDYGRGLAPTLHAFGAFSVLGWDYSIVTRLVKSAVNE